MALTKPKECKNPQIFADIITARYITGRDKEWTHSMCPCGNSFFIRYEMRDDMSWELPIDTRKEIMYE